MYVRPLLKSSPHSGVGGWAPMPKKLKEDAVRIEDPIDILYCTMMSGIALGRMW